ncbi:hypothetical protein [Pleionea sp. CnH1-48]|uniref:hypothetical protein n=1 Tax=Pleionea sp. CnH1-48 TaxID=2954494 RepID=UPI002097917D|nr:hypothetical protein [Pleionea sp. CnH1-48]MCO7225002.1 hypothetical protein [Pleionea sp. CnH1-48]
MLRWISVLLIVSLAINTITLIILLQHKHNDIKPTVEDIIPRPTQTDFAEANTSEQSQHIIHISNGLQKLSFQIQKLEALISRQEISEASIQDHPISNQLQQTFEEANQLGHERIDVILSQGNLDHESIHELRRVMSKMSPKEHHQALQKLVIAINNGELILQPGVTL